MRYGFKNAEEVKETSLKYNLHSWSVQGKLNPAVVEKAEGIYYYTADGKKMADMSSQLVNLNVGYGNKDIIDAIKEQAEKLAYISPAYAIDCRSKLAEMVVKVAPKNMGKVFFTLGGADANENAIKIAKLVTGRYKIFSRYRAYHGSSFGAGVACLNFYEKEHIMDKVKERGKQLGTLLEDIKAKHKSVGDVRYIGLFSCVELTKDKATHEPLVPFGKDPEGIMGKIVGMLKAKGFNTYSHEACIFVCPPLIITEEELAENMAILDEVLTEVDKMV